MRGCIYARSDFYKVLIVKDGKYYVTNKVYDCEMDKFIHLHSGDTKYLVGRNKYELVEELYIEGPDCVELYRFIWINIYDCPLAREIYNILKHMLTPCKRKFEWDVYWHRGISYV